MSLIDKLINSPLGLKGEKPKSVAPTPTAGVHVSDKTRGNQGNEEYLRGSNLDLDGKTPTDTYRNRAPEGARLP